MTLRMTDSPNVYRAIKKLREKAEREDDNTLEEIERNLGHDMSTAVKEIVEEIDAAALRKVVKDDEELTWFWQNSDVIPKEFFLEFTKDCPTKDKCCMSGRVRGSTMMGVAHHYDSKGQLHVWDRNRQKVNIVCNECWKAGIVSNREDADVYEIEIIKEAEE